MTVPSAARVGVFGKVPWRAEYLKVRWDGDPFTSFDSWMTDNVEWAAVHAQRAFADASSTGSGGMHAFVFRPKNGQGVLSGAIVASADSAGRSYPLAVGAPLSSAPELGACPEVLPLVLEDFWQSASEIAGAVRAAGSVDGAASATPADFTWSVDVAQACAAYAEWATALPLGDLFSLIYGADGPTLAAQAVRFTVEALRPFRGVDRPRTPLTLRLPLGAAGGAAVCFWVDLVRRAAGWRSTIPSFFWSHDGAAGNLLLHLGDPPRSTLCDLFTSPDDRGDLCDLTGPLSAAQLQAIPDLPPALASCFDRECRVSDLASAAGVL
ncbi:MAG: type VI secretion system-associated protein TagF [Polyangiaceae bacterium]